MFTERRSGLRPHKQTPAQGWPDIVGPLLLALCGGFGLEAFTPHSVNNLALAYLTHAWYLAIVGFWVWILGRRFPLGRLSRQGLSGWFRPWILVGTLYLVLVLLSPGPPAHHAIVSLLIFQGVVVGPTEELLFRGLIQTAMNHSIMASPVWGSLRLGTIGTALVFGLAHVGNLWYQPLSLTIGQASFAFVIGLILGHYYDRTQNLWGAAILHNLIDLLSVAVPLIIGH